MVKNLSSLVSLLVSSSLILQNQFHFGLAFPSAFHLIDRINNDYTFKLVLRMTELCPILKLMLTHGN